MTTEWLARWLPDGRKAAAAAVVRIICGKRDAAGEPTCPALLAYVDWGYPWVMVMAGYLEVREGVWELSKFALRQVAKGRLPRWEKPVLSEAGERLMIWRNAGPPFPFRIKCWRCTDVNVVDSKRRGQRRATLRAATG